MASDQWGSLIGLIETNRARVQETEIIESELCPRCLIRVQRDSMTGERGCTFCGWRESLALPNA